MPTAHHRKDCPGRCGRRIVHRMIACWPCMSQLPSALRDDITKAVANCCREPNDQAHEAAHRRAVTAALAWYRQRNAEESTNV